MVLAYGDRRAGILPTPQMGQKQVGTSGITREAAAGSRPWTDAGSTVYPPNTCIAGWSKEVRNAVHGSGTGFNVSASVLSLQMARKNPF